MIQRQVTLIALCIEDIHILLRRRMVKVDAKK